MLNDSHESQPHRLRRSKPVQHPWMLCTQPCSQSALVIRRARSPAVSLAGGCSESSGQLVAAMIPVFAHFASVRRHVVHQVAPELGVEAGHVVITE